MPATIFSGSKVKALKDRLSLNDVTEVISVTSNPQTGGLVAPIGSLALDSVAGKIYKKVGSANTNWSEVGAGVGGINYISNPDAENGTTGWNTYADAAGAQPVDGTGGTAAVTWTRSTTTPLRGAADFNFAKDAVNRQGQGVSIDFTIDAADQAKVLTVSFDYEILSGTYADGDLTVYLVQDPAGTPVVIQPAGYVIASAVAGTKMREIATFQTASNVTSYRLCLHVASTSASAYTLAVDNVVVSPQVVQYGAPITGSVAYTPTITGFGTVTNVAFYSKRIGDSLEVEGYFTAGTPTATQAQITLGFGGQNANVVADVSRVRPGSIIGQAGQSGAASTYFGMSVLSPATNQNYINLGAQTSTGAELTAVNGNFVVAAANISVKFKVPIVGWNSTVVMSNDTDTRIVDLQVNNASSITPSGTIGTSFATATTINLNKTPTKDSHNGYSAGVYTVAVPGDYFVSARLEMSHTASTGSFVSASIAVNGVERAVQAIKPVTTGNAYPFVSSLITGLVAGDQITIRLYGDSAAKAFVASSVHDFTVHRLSGPSAIAASETVAARYTNTAGTSVPTGGAGAGLVPVPFANRSYDSHGFFNGSTGVGTIPIAGTYRISCSFYFQAQAWTAIGKAVAVRKNGVIAGYLAIYTPASASTIDLGLVGTTEIRFNAGDTFDLNLWHNEASARTISTLAETNQITISRIGN